MRTKGSSRRYFQSSIRRVLMIWRRTLLEGAASRSRKSIIKTTSLLWRRVNRILIRIRATVWWRVVNRAVSLLGAIHQQPLKTQIRSLRGARSIIYSRIRRIGTLGSRHWQWGMGQRTIWIRIRGRRRVSGYIKLEKGQARHLLQSKSPRIHQLCPIRIYSSVENLSDKDSVPWKGEPNIQRTTFWQASMRPMRAAL